MNDVEKEQFDDAMIEARQLVQWPIWFPMSYSSCLDHTTISKQQLEWQLDNLTIFEALLAVLAVITGFFGMDIPLPMTGSQCLDYVSYVALYYGSFWQGHAVDCEKDKKRLENPSLFISRIIWEIGTI